MPYDMVPPGVWVAVSAVFGLLFGSFLNVVIYRWPREESIVLPASHCGACGTPIAPYDNIPLLSYAILGGRCRACKTKISMRYPAVEALTGLLFAAAAYVDGPSLKLILDCVFLLFVVPLVFIDADVQFLPAVITHPGLVFALAARVLEPNLFGISPEGFGGAALGLSESPDWYVSLVGAAFGGALGGGFLYVTSVVYFVVRGRIGMGLGDVAMMCMVGAYLGWELTLLTVLLGSVIGSLAGVYVMIFRGGRMDELKLPFGVFLGAGAIVALLVGQQLIFWYTGLMGA